MNTRALIASLTAASLAGLLGCSTPKTAAPPMTIYSVPIPAPEYELRDGQLIPKSMQPFGQICKLGTSCLSLDSRPFEPCLLSTTKCSDKGVEPILVAPPKSVAPDPSVILY
jgi:hypothetical protein